MQERHDAATMTPTRGALTSATVHIDTLGGRISPQLCEAVVKALARASRMGVEPDARAAGLIPSTRGTL